MSTAIENVSDLMGRMVDKTRMELATAKLYPWVIVNRDTGRELDAYADWREAQVQANRANIYSHRTGSDRLYVVKYEGPTKRLIMTALRGLFGRHV